MRRVEYSPFFSDLSLSILTNNVEHFYAFLRGFIAEVTRSRKGKPEFFSDALVEQALRFFSTDRGFFKEPSSPRIK
jgi:hypothetical protein